MYIYIYIQLMYHNSAYLHMDRSTRVECAWIHKNKTADVQLLTWKVNVSLVRNICFGNEAKLFNLDEPKLMLGIYENK